mmetsp:Transcript_11136/g.16418  ORF Transcript_11136/g.16418 Transcript_11136/m.16418 type:complete len:460 (+) Transcript_11136:126-1505(+)
MSQIIAHRVSEKTKAKVGVTKEVLEEIYTDMVKKHQEKIINCPTGSSLYKEFVKKRTRKYQWEKISVIGKGAYGQVLLVRNKVTKEIQAMKMLKKIDMIRRNQVAHVRAERDILAKNNSSGFIIGLDCSFQDDEYLYLIMDYMPGGDMMTWLINKDIFTEDETRFYIAELVLAVEAIHKMNYVHRDLKPDNILIDKKGHIKLSDFGLSKPYKVPTEEDKIYAEQLQKESKTTEKKNDSINKLSWSERTATWKRTSRKMLFSPVGSNAYIAPEVLLKRGYDHSCDWWSVGIIMFEMLCGYPPFIAENPQEVRHKIVRWREFLEFPVDIKLSEAAEDLITKLITSAKERIGSKTIEDIKAHPFFADIDWQNIRQWRAPFLPNLKGEDDHHYFENYVDSSNFSQKNGLDKHPNYFNDEHHVFYGYSYTGGRKTQKITPNSPKSVFDTNFFNDPDEEEVVDDE